MATRSDRVAVAPTSAVSLPVPPQAFHWAYQDDEEIGIRDHSKEIKRYYVGRRSSLSQWTPIVSAVDLRLRKEQVRKLMRDAHDSFCQCGCTAHKRPERKSEPAIARSIPVTTTAAPPPSARARTKKEQSQTKRALQQRYVSLDELPPDVDEESSAARLLNGIKRIVRRESDRLRSNSLTDLFATATGTKRHWYRRGGWGGSLASLSGSLSGSMPQLNVMQWNEDDGPAMGSLPPEFRVSRVSHGPATRSPPAQRRSEILVRFNLDQVTVYDTYPKSEYDRNGANPKPTTEEMCAIRQEMAKFKLIEMEVSAFSRHNTHIFNSYQCGLTRTKMTSNRRLPPVA